MVKKLNNWPIDFIPSELLLAFSDDWDAIERYRLDKIDGFTIGIE